MNQSPSPTVLTFEKLDLFKFNLMAQAWNLDCIQLKPGKLSADISQVICADCQLGYAMFSNAAKQEGVSPEGVWTFAFVNEVKIYWRNYIVHPSSIIIYAPGSEINAVSAANWEVVTFSISERILIECAGDMKAENFIESLTSIDLMSCQNEGWRSLRNSIIKKIANQVQNPTAEIDQPFIHSFTKKLLGLLKDSKVSTDKVSTKKRLTLLQSAERFMLQNLAEQISISDIASQLKVSERTLLYAFKERFDIGPKAFMNILKLNHVHHILHKATDVNSIASIARESGFWHMGQFYKDYKKFFGELPSHTLKKSEAKAKTIIEKG